MIKTNSLMVPIFNTMVFIVKYMEIPFDTIPHILSWSHVENLEEKLIRVPKVLTFIQWAPPLFAGWKNQL